MSETLNNSTLSGIKDFTDALHGITELSANNPTLVREQTFRQNSRLTRGAYVLRLLGATRVEPVPTHTQRHLQFGTPNIFTGNEYGLPQGQREIVIVQKAEQPTPQSILLRVVEGGKELGSTIELTENPELLLQATNEINQLAKFYNIVN